MMKKTIGGTIKKVLTKGKDSFMKVCSECGHYYPKDSFCSRCMLTEDSLEKFEKRRSQNSIESR